VEIRYKGNEELIPQELPSYAEVAIDFEKDYDEFWKASRTSSILKLLDRLSAEVRLGMG